MKEKINEFIGKLLQSFENNKHGLSSRKLTAFVIICLYSFAHMKWAFSCYKNNEYSLLPEILMIDATFILTLLGLTTWQGIKEKQIDKGMQPPADDKREPFTNV
jgi:hypothetical protein